MQTPRCLFLFDDSVQKKECGHDCFAAVAATTLSGGRREQKSAPQGAFRLSIYGALPIGRDTLSARAAVRLEGVIRYAIGAITALTPTNVVVAVNNAGLVQRAADDCACREGCQRIPPAITVAAIAVAVVARAVMAMPVTGTVRRTVAAMGRATGAMGIAWRAARPVGVARRTFVALGMTARWTAIIANLFDVLIESRTLKVHRRSHGWYDGCKSKDQRQGPRARLFQNFHMQPSVWNDATKRLKTQLVPFPGDDWPTILTGGL